MPATNNEAEEWRLTCDLTVAEKKKREKTLYMATETVYSIVISLAIIMARHKQGELLDRFKQVYKG